MFTVGLDVHARSVVMRAIDGATGEVIHTRLCPDHGDIRRWLATLADPVAVHGRPSAVLMAPADLESLEETIAILSDREAMQRLNASEAELTAGLGESEADLAAAMERRRRASMT